MYFNIHDRLHHAAGINQVSAGNSMDNRFVQTGPEADRRDVGRPQHGFIATKTATLQTGSTTGTEKTERIAVGGR